MKMQRPLKAKVCLSSPDILLLIHSNMYAPLATILKYFVFFFFLQTYRVSKVSDSMTSCKSELEQLVSWLLFSLQRQTTKIKNIIKGFAGNFQFEGIQSIMAVKTWQQYTTWQKYAPCPYILTFRWDRSQRAHRAAPSGPHFPWRLYHLTVLKYPAPPARDIVLKHIISWRMFYI